MSKDAKHNGQDAYAVVPNAVIRDLDMLAAARAASVTPVAAPISGAQDTDAPAPGDATTVGSPLNPSPFLKR